MVTKEILDLVLKWIADLSKRTLESIASVTQLSKMVREMNDLQDRRIKNLELAVSKLSSRAEYDDVEKSVIEKVKKEYGVN